MVKVIKTHTGKIYVDKERKLEFLTVGDYGKENNIKANFLGLTKEINGVNNTEVDLTDKWVATISTQKGCPMKCRFCDCPKYGFYGNATLEDLKYQIETIISRECVDHTNRFNVHFARMGEPTFNSDVLDFAEHYLRDIVSAKINAKTIHPVVSTMLPKGNIVLEDFILKWCVEENHRLEDEVRKLHDNLMMERNRKPKPTIVRKDFCYSLNMPDKYIEAVKNNAKEELLHDVETFIHEEEMDHNRVRFSIALFPIEDKRFM